MNSKQVKEFLASVVYMELEQEYLYQSSKDIKDTEYISKLIESYRYLIKDTSLPIIEDTIINDMIDKYINNL